MTTLYAIIFILGTISSRTIIVGARTGMIERRIILVVIGTLANLLTLSLIVWGFASLPWPWATAVTVIGFLSSAIVSNGNHAKWARLSPLLNLIVVIGGAYLWMERWPF